MVLLVVDTQNLITNSDLYNFNVFENAVKVLPAAARENNLEVISIHLLKKKNIIQRPGSTEIFEIPSMPFPMRACPPLCL